MKRRRLLAIYIFLINTIGLIVLGMSLNNRDRWGEILFFIAVTLVAEALPVETPLGAGTTVSASFGLIYATIITFGPKGAALIAALGTLSFSDLKEKPWYRNLFNMSQLAICTYLAGVIYVGMGGSIGTFSLSQNLLPLATAFLVHFMLNSTLPTLAASLASGMTWGKVWQRSILWAVPNFLALGPLGVLLAVVYQGMGFASIVLFMIPLLIARNSLQMYKRMRQTYIETVHTLTQAIEAKDHYTRGHSDRVAVYATAIARRMGLPEHMVDLIYFLSLLHDVGKIGVREQVLNKREMLDRDEWREINRHSDVGANIVREIGFLRQGVDSIRFHHERFDGSGYPAGIKGSEIPLGARIIAVADAFDAMTSERVYRRARSIEGAIEELQKCAGCQFDPEVVKAFLLELKENSSLLQVRSGIVRISSVS